MRREWKVVRSGFACDRALCPRQGKTVDPRFAGCGLEDPKGVAVGLNYWRRESARRARSVEAGELGHIPPETYHI